MFFVVNDLLLGGFDPRLQDNIDTLNLLTGLCDAHSLTYCITPPLSTIKTAPVTQPNVILLLNFTNAQRTWLLTSPSTRALLYTPTNEHFGIIPVEGMVSCLPVLACNSGGPTESIIDPEFSGKPGEVRTGWLRPPEANAWSAAILEILQLSARERVSLGQRARQRAVATFSLDAMAKSIEEALQEAVKSGEVEGQLLYWCKTILSVFVLCTAFWQYYSI